MHRDRGQDMHTHTHTKEEREKSYICWLIPQLSAVTRTGTVQSQEPRASASSPTWVSGGTKSISQLSHMAYWGRKTHLGRPSSTAFPRALAEEWIGSEATRTQTGNSYEMSTSPIFIFLEGSSFTAFSMNVIIERL